MLVSQIQSVLHYVRLDSKNYPLPFVNVITSLGKYVFGNEIWPDPFNWQKLLECLLSIKLF